MYPPPPKEQKGNEGNQDIREDNRTLEKKKYLRDNCICNENE